MPGNWNHRELTDKMAESVPGSRGIPIEVQMIAVNRRITTDPERIKTSVVSHEIIAGCICPGAGRDGRFTANAMAAAYEPLCISAMGRNDIPASDPFKTEAALARRRSGIELVDRSITPRSLAMRRGFENAIAGVMATGGSINAVLDLLTTADDFGLALSINGSDRLSRSRPCAITFGAARHGLWPRSLHQ
jgi:dihydroxyacid dehydratase/phosphogluconate dehydratase